MGMKYLAVTLLAACASVPAPEHKQIMEGAEMIWPWEQFDWGVFWAMAAVFAIRGIWRAISHVIATW